LFRKNSNSLTDSPVLTCYKATFALPAFKTYNHKGVYLLLKRLRYLVHIGINPIYERPLESI